VARSEVPIIPVWTKSDVGGPPPGFILTNNAGRGTTDPSHGGANSRRDDPPAGDVAPHHLQPTIVSAHTGAGLAALTTRIQHELAARHHLAESDAPLLTRDRHVRAVRTARAELDAFDEARRSGAVPATIAAVHLRAATHALETLIGTVDVDDVLDRVFSSFCVGK
jgi:tRNA modification GTPase